MDSSAADAIECEAGWFEGYQSCGIEFGAYGLYVLGEPECSPYACAVGLVDYFEDGVEYDVGEFVAF